MMISVLKRIGRAKYTLSLFFLGVGGVIWATNPRLIEWHGTAFGTTVKVLAIVPRFKLSNARYEHVISTVLNRVDVVFSTYSPNSELSKFNGLRDTTPMLVSTELYGFFKSSKKLAQQLNGAWDPTLAPLSEYYGLQPSQRHRTKDQARALVGFDLVTLLPNFYIQKKKKGVTVDFSSNAKGYAVDALVLALQDMGADAGFVDIGGEIRTFGVPKKHRPWRIGIQSPIEAGAIVGVIEGLTMAVATSGNYLNHVNGVGHILDPRKKGPVSHNLISVSVIADTCFVADTLATGLFVMGEEEARRWLDEHPKYPALLMVKSPNNALIPIEKNGFFKPFQRP
jgi:thiamine biosynthesis lipoprotein